MDCRKLFCIYNCKNIAYKGLRTSCQRNEEYFYFYLGPWLGKYKNTQEARNAGSNAGDNLRKTEKVIKENSFYPRKSYTMLQLDNWF